jgi:hypothetical protein
MLKAILVTTATLPARMLAPPLMPSDRRLHQWGQLLPSFILAMRLAFALFAPASAFDDFGKAFQKGLPLIWRHNLGCGLDRVCESCAIKGRRVFDKVSKFCSSSHFQEPLL